MIKYDKILIKENWIKEKTHILKDEQKYNSRKSEMYMGRARI